ncbi:MAG: Beta-N-acetylhexosaminidase [Deltaproteobacteria bacterium]|nr:Beta-N-acetylhexosaminidase [Deltaproteobacteria bacterium]
MGFPKGASIPFAIFKQRWGQCPGREVASITVLYCLSMDTLRQKIGQMFLVGCQGESLTRDEQLIYAEYQFGGFILFKRNCVEPEQILSLCGSLWEAADKTPPFIAIDQEGGRVHRLPQPFTHFPASARIGEMRNADLARRLGRATAEELKLVGINLNFAPVLDVDSNPANPIIGDRAFGADPQQVIEIAAAWTQGLRDGGVIPCGKHFPGHGDTANDSHLEQPKVRKSLDELRSVELPPFAHSCRNRIESLMTAHVLYPALDPNFPATLSENIVTGLLRHQLGYDGVIFSDDMEMKAISDNYGVKQATALAVRAGVNVLLFCHEVDKAIPAFEFLCNEAGSDPVVRARVADSSRRIAELKQRYLTSFTGASANEVVARIAALDHRRLVRVNFGDG